VLSTEPEASDFFSDGLHDDILTQLAKVSSLDVIARTSVMRFAGSEASIPDIGRELRVGTILEGGVQRSGTRIRLNVQLIDAKTATHLWGETYDRELTAENIFLIQSELAASIAEELSAVLNGEERRALAQVPTVSLQAYDFYLRGSRPIRNSTAEVELEQAEEALERAVEIDDEFALAYARLAQVHLKKYWFAFDRTDDRLERASAAVLKAEVLDPENPEVLIARGYYHYYGFRNYAAAEESFSAAQQALPGDARLLEARALVLRRNARWDEAVELFEAAVELDPLNVDLLGSFGETLQRMGEYASSRRVLERALAVDSADLVIRSRLAYLDVLSDGDMTQGDAMLEGFDRTAAFAFQWWQRGYLAGDDSMAMGAARDVDGVIEQQTALFSRTLLNAIYHRTRGREQQALAAADSAALLFEGVAQQRTDDPRAFAALGTAYALQGLREPALRAGNEAVRLMPVERDAMDGPEYVLRLAQIYALLGDLDSAADLVARMLSAPSDHSLESVLLDPVLSPLRDHPRLRER
jgi:TolB-like protein/Flp pilus assembly protein TadD